MAFYNVQMGDVPVLKSLADEYTMSDNFHQSVMGGTGPNHVMLGTGDAIFWSDGNGNPTVPPSHIANPNPQPGTDDVYTVDLNFDGNFASRHFMGVLRRRVRRSRNASAQSHQHESAGAGWRCLLQYLQLCDGFFCRDRQQHAAGGFFVKPEMACSNGHPASSKLDLFEGMVENIVDHLKANPALMAQTALFITFDEGGGFYDSGYIQPLDFFGDGPRIPMMAVNVCASVWYKSLRS